MKTEEMMDCIITFFDLIDIRKDAHNGKGSSKMIKMHRKVVPKIDKALPLHRYGYVWNDSVLLLSYAVRLEERRKLLAELNDFKIWLESECDVGSYAISVMGKTFHNDTKTASLHTSQSRAVLLKTSSWAMANCLIIEKELKKRRAEWYLDSRITKGLRLGNPFASDDVKLLPSNRSRKIYMYKKLNIEPI